MPTDTGAPLFLSKYATGERNWGVTMDANIQSINDAIGALQTVGGGGNPAGANGDLQFKNGAVFGANSLLHWDDTGHTLTVGPASPSAMVPSASIVDKPIFSYGASGIQRLTLGRIGSRYFGDNLEVLHVYQSYDDAEVGTGFPNAVETHALFSGASGDSLSGSIRGGYFLGENEDSNKIGFLAGIGADAMSSLGDCSYMAGIEASAGTIVPGTAARSPIIDQAVGLDVTVSAFTDIALGGSATSLITLGQGIHVGGDASTRGTITTWHGIDIDTPTTTTDDAGPGGTIGTKVGLNIGDYTGGLNDYAIYVAGGTTRLDTLLMNGAITFSGGQTFPNFPESQITNLVSDLALKAPLASPAFTGHPTGVTELSSDSSTRLATTALVDSKIALIGSAVSSVFGRTGAVVAAANDYSFAQLSGSAAVGQIPNLPASIITSGVLALAQGGNTFALLGDLIYGGTAAAPTVLSGNTTATKKYLSQTGNGTISAAPSWAQIAAGDLSGLATVATTGAYADLSGSPSLAAIATSGKWSDLQSATAALTLSNAGNASTFNHTSAVTWTLANTTAATSGTSQSSPLFSLNGKYWDGAASQTDSWTFQNVVANGTNGTSQLQFVHAGTTGAASVAVPGGSSSASGLQIGPGGPGLFQQNATAMGIQSTSSSSGSLALYGTTTQFWLLNTTGSGTLVQFATAFNGNAVMAIAGLNKTQTLAANPALLIGSEGGNNGQITSTSGTAVGVSIGNGSTGNVGGLRFSPSSGTANFIALNITPQINQTSTSSGNYTGLQVNVIETSLKGTANLLLDLQAGASGGTSQFSISNAGKATRYNAIATVAGGLAAIYAQANLTAQAANVAATTLYAVPAAGAGLYRVSVFIIESQAATSSSTMPDTRIIYTDQDSNATITIAATASSAGNSTSTFAQATFIVNAKNSTNIQYSIGQANAYASSGATPMQFAYHARAEYLG